MKEVLVVGAGFSGAVVARQLAEAGFVVQVIEARGHLGGNCHTERDPQTKVMVHVYGPHVFHTSNQEVWSYVQRFGEWVPFVNRIKAHTEKGIFGLPINLHTINQFFGQTLTPRGAREFLATKVEQGIGEPANFEEQALKCLGRELYETFFQGYTRKQWGCEPTELPAAVFSRLPVRFNYDDSYYDCLHQAIPREGYTQLIENILTHPRVRLHLNTPWDKAMRQQAGHVFVTGALDQFFGFSEGRLGYRTVYWQGETHTGDFQGNAIINYPGAEVPWTRVLEHKHFTPWESHALSLVFREFSKETGVDDPPYYPKRLEPDRRILQRYLEMARDEPGVSFLGRLGTYRYLDMDQVIAEALALSRQWLQARAKG